jgi:hypothetical protein
MSSGEPARRPRRRFGPVPRPDHRGINAHRRGQWFRTFARRVDSFVGDVDGEQIERHGDDVEGPSDALLGGVISFLIA